MSQPPDKFSIAFDHSPLALMITSLDTGRLVDVNQGFVRLSGYSRDEAIGRSPDELGLQIDPAARAERYRLLRLGQLVPEIEARFRLKSGDEAIGVIASSVVDIDGHACELSSLLDVTERRRAEQTMREHAEHYRAIVETQSEMVCRFRRDGTILFVNTAYARARATTVEALTGANFWRFVPPADRSGVERGLDALTPDTPEVRIENRFETAEGLRWILWTNRALTFDAAGQPLELQSSGVDITEIRRAEEALRQSESRYRHIFDTAGVSIWDEDFSEVKRALDALRADGVQDFARYFREHPDWVDHAIGLVRVRAVNPATLRMFGADAESQLLGSLHTVSVPDTRRVFVGELLAIAEARTAFEAETTLRTLDGRTVAVLLTLTFPPPDGRFDSVLVTLTDITDRKRAEVALRESEAQLRSFADTAPAMLWVTNAEGHCTFLSRAWYDVTGQREADALPDGWLSAVHTDDRDRTGQLRAEATRLRAPVECEFRLRGRDGSYRWMLDAGRPRVSDDGSFIGCVGSVIDIHDRKTAEMRVRASETHFRQLAEALEQSNRIKDDFLATLSHELRTPLNAVLGWTHMLKSGALTPEVAAKALDSLERNARAQTQLIDDLLDMSRIVSGRLQIAETAVDVGAVVAAAVDTLRPAAVSKHVDLQVTVASELLQVKGDADRLRQVLWNLLSNAIKFTPAGGRVSLEASGDLDHVRVVVRDSGEGIAPEFLPHVFERFRQADATSTRRHGGLGLGLSIARHMAEAHKGTLTVASDGRNRGATFTLQIPRERSPQTGTEAGSADLRRSETPLAGRSLLVVDDEDDARELFRVALELAGGEVVVASCAAEALEALRTHRFDVVLADLGMPGRGGVELVRAMRALPPPIGQLPALAVTAYVSHRERELAFEAGFNAHITKPIEIERLLTAVLDALPDEPRPRASM